MSQRTVLVVDDEIKMRRILEIMLQDMGHAVLKAGDGKAALEILDKESVDLIITDLRMHGMDGLSLLKTLREQGHDIPIIMITAHGTVETAVTAMKYGAVDYILRPFEVETVELAVARALSVERVQSENRFLRGEFEKGWGEFIGRSSAMQNLYRLIEQIAASPSPVFIVGETGTGKELVARAIHRASAREGLFVPINCAAIPASILESELFGHVRGAFTGAHSERIGKFEVADRGTLFLDEVTEMPIDLQVKLLRALQESQIERVGSNRPIDIDIRVLAATNRDPAVAVAEGRLRNDLFYRLNVLHIDVPPMRERREDIPTLAQHFLSMHARDVGMPIPILEQEAIDKLCAYDWPGNVRELENVMERALVLSDGRAIGRSVLDGLSVVGRATTMPVTTDDADLALQPRIEALERQTIEKALDSAGSNKSKAARLLDISERSLWYKLKKYGLR
jgi:two-component system response regulator AtoC